MSKRALSNPNLISKNAALENLAAELLQEPVVAVDTESNSLYAYKEKVCLIQFSTRTADFLVDPLPFENLAPLQPLFESKHIEKVFHAAEYDLICLKRDFGFKFSNLFDTMVAAGILGYPSLGLGSLLMDEFGVKTNKRFQRANWGERPLPQNLKKYAQQDTHYLLPLRDRLREALKKRNLWKLASEDFDRLCKVKTPKNGGLAQGEVEKGFWRIHGAYDLDPRNAAVLLELCRYRDKVARSENKPIFKVLSDQTLFAIAQQTPRDIESFYEIQGMSERQVRRHGRNLLHAVKKGSKSGPLYPPKRVKPNGQYLNRIEILKRWRKASAGKMGVNPDVILPRDLLNSVAQKNPSCKEELAEVFEAVPWRMEHFGDQIIAVLKD